MQEKHLRNIENFRKLQEGFKQVEKMRKKATKKKDLPSGNLERPVI